MPNLSIDQAGSLTASRSLAGLKPRISVVPTNIRGRYGFGVLEHQLAFKHKAVVMGWARIQISFSISENCKTIIKKFSSLYSIFDISTQ